MPEYSSKSLHSADWSSDDIPSGYQLWELFSFKLPGYFFSNRMSLPNLTLFCPQIDIQLETQGGPCRDFWSCLYMYSSFLFGTLPCRFQLLRPPETPNSVTSNGLAHWTLLMFFLPVLQCGKCLQAGSQSLHSTHFFGSLLWITQY